MKITVFEDGLDIFVPDEEMVEMYKIISRADYTSPLKYQLLNEIIARSAVNLCALNADVMMFPKSVE